MISLEQRSRDMMAEPRLWPIYPYLPLKKPNPKAGWPELAIATEDESGKLRLYVMTGVETLFSVDLRVTPYVIRTIDELLTAGWIVD